MLADRLKNEGLKVMQIREPGGTTLSETIRDVLLDPGYRIDPFAEMLLFSAARSQLVSESIIPALKEDTVVICDRFFDSTIAYQGAGRGVADEAWLMDFQLHVTGQLQPARTYLIEVPTEVALARRSDRTEDRMEASGAELQKRVAHAYSELARLYPERICTIDGRDDPAAIHRKIWEDLCEQPHIDLKPSERR